MGAFAPRKTTVARRSSFSLKSHGRLSLRESMGAFAPRKTTVARRSSFSLKSHGRLSLRESMGAFAPRKTTVARRSSFSLTCCVGDYHFDVRLKPDLPEDAIIRGLEHLMGLRTAVSPAASS